MPFFEQAREHSGWRFHQTCGLLAKWMWSCCGLAVWHHCWLETSCTTLFWARLGKVSWGLLRLKRTPFRSSEVSGTFWPSRWRHPVVVIAPESTRKSWGCYVGHALRTMFLIYLYILVMVQFSSCVFFVVLLSLHTYTYIYNILWHMSPKCISRVDTFHLFHHRETICWFNMTMADYGKNHHVS